MRTAQFLKIKTPRGIDSTHFAITGRIAILVGQTLLGVFLLCSSSHASDLISIAVSQIGKGETISNNKGPEVKTYLNGKDNLPWCAGFVSYCLKQSDYKLPYTLRAKDFLKLGKIVNSPNGGDLIVLSRQGGGHVGIIESVSGDKITSIEGNTGNFPSKVKRITYKGKIKNLVAFVRIGRGV